MSAVNYVDFDPKIYLPVGYYPWPDLINDNVEEMGLEEAQWIDTDFSFVSESIRDKYKRVRLYNVTSRMLPHLTREQLLPCVRTLFWHTFIDDQYEHLSISGLRKLRERVVAIMQGDRVLPEENGLLRQIALSGRELNAFAPQEWMERQIDAFDEYLRFGVGEEAYYRKSKKLPTMANYSLFREYSIGMYPYYNSVEIGLGFPFYNSLFRHPVIQQARRLASRITIWQNDIHSLRKDLYTERETLNAVFVLQNEYDISLDDALAEVMRIHDSEVAELVSLQNDAGSFSGKERDIIKEYILRMGVAIQGINTFYSLEPQRYVVTEGFPWPDTEPLMLRSTKEPRGAQSEG